MITVQMFELGKLFHNPIGANLPKLRDHVLIKMRAKAKILSIIEQYGQTCIVVMVDSSEKPGDRKISLMVNDKDAEQVCMSAYLGTILIDAGQNAIHLFDGGDQS